MSLLFAASIAGVLLMGSAAKAATPTLNVVADATAEFGDSASATVTIVGGQSPTGTIKLSLYGPSSPNCEGGPAERTQTVNGPGPYHDGYMVLAPGTWKWKITYSGDANNTAVTTACGVAATEVDPLVPDATSIEANATGSVILGEPIEATAEVEGDDVIFQDMTFNLYGPGDTNCSASPIYNKEIVDDGTLEPGAQSSGEYTPNAAGTYRWQVVYEGDEWNEPSETTCGQLNTIVLAKNCAADETGTPPDCKKKPVDPPKCAAGDTGTPPYCVKPGTKTAKISVGGVSPKTKSVKKNKSVTYKVTVTNSGDADATGVKACATVAKKTFKIAKKCVDIGTVSAGGSKTASIKVKATKKAKGSAKVSVKVSSANGGGGNVSATVKVAGKK